MNNFNFSKFKQKFRKYWNKFWFLLWKDTSWKGWLFSLVFLFVFIKLIFFPTLSLITGTQLPLAIVESCSMYHDGNFFSDYDSWWILHEGIYDRFYITKEVFREFPFKKGFTKGDILFIVGTDPSKLEVGDVIVFLANQKNPIIHRIVKIKEDSSGKRVFSTQGDNNFAQLPFEKEISEDQILGRASFRILPYVGWVKLIFYEPQRSPFERGGCQENALK